MLKSYQEDINKYQLSLDAMERLKTGCQYDLASSACSSNEISVQHVKLTDAALKAIEECYEWTRTHKVISLMFYSDVSREDLTDTLRI